MKQVHINMTLLFSYSGAYQLFREAIAVWVASRHGHVISWFFDGARASQIPYHTIPPWFYDTLATILSSIDSIDVVLVLSTLSLINSVILHNVYFSASYSVHIRVSLTWLFLRWEEYCPCPIVKVCDYHSYHLDVYQSSSWSSANGCRHQPPHVYTIMYLHLPQQYIYFIESRWLNTSYNYGSTLSSDGKDCLQRVF